MYPLDEALAWPRTLCLVDEETTLLCPALAEISHRESKKGVVEENTATEEMTETRRSQAHQMKARGSNDLVKSLENFLNWCT